MSELVPINVHDIDEGKLLSAIDDHLAIVGKNVAKSPNKTGKRKVKIEITLVPVYDAKDGRAEVSIQWKVDYTIPGSQSQVSIGTIAHEKCLLNPWDGGDPRQTIIEEVASPYEEDEAQPENVQAFSPQQQTES